MKKILLLSMALLQLAFAYCQEINYLKTFDETKAKAVKEHKPIFIAFTSPIVRLPQFPNASFASGLDAKDVIEFYNKNFVCYTVSTGDTANKQIRKIINTTTYPTYVFLDSKAGLVYKSMGNSIMSKRYIDIAQNALDRITSGNTLGHYDEIYKAGNVTADLLKHYITLREELDITDNDKLADEYVDFLTVKALNDYAEVLFILKCGPNYTSKAYKLAFTYPKLIDSIYKQEPLATRQAINNRIIINTRNEAISKKNANMAFGLNNFISGTYGKNYRDGSKAAANNMLFYYFAVKDTNNYCRQASYYFDTYYLNISPDSAKKLQQLALDNIKQRLTNRPDNDKLIPDPGKQDPRRFPVLLSTGITSSQNSTVATELNHAAWNFYLIGTRNPDYLVKALVWCRKAIEVQPTEYSYYDTMAHIMYRLNFYDEAQLNQQKAIDMASAASMPTETIDNIKSELMKMKERKL